MTGASESPFAGAGPDAVFEEYLRQGRLMLQRCRKSGRFFFYPRVMAPGTGAIDLEWVEASGHGTVYATTVVRQRPERGGSYNVALIEFAEGVRMMSRVVGIAPEGVQIGMPVRARIEELDGVPAVVFEPSR